MSLLCSTNAFSVIAHCVPNTPSVLLRRLIEHSFSVEYVYRVIVADVHIMLRQILYFSVVDRCLLGRIILSPSSINKQPEGGS